LPTIADYAAGMPKPKEQALADDAIAQTSESALPSKKPPAPSARHRLKRGRKAKLLK
jgi:hypothetical protein